MLKPALIVIGGPTASGKTKVAIETAVALHTSIVNADSRQIFKELNIGVAKPSVSELSQVPHHLVSAISIHSHFGAGEFERTATEILNQIFQKSPFAVVCGGTGLYLNSLINGLDPLPKVSAETREKVNNMQVQLGLPGMVELLLKEDPNAEDYTELQNPARVKRALELILTTGKSPNQYFSQTKKELPWQVFGYYLNPDREILYSQINSRVDRMIEEGLEFEARALLQYRNLTALRTVGYSEFFDYFDGKYTLQDCINKIKQHTRNYAKRQLTWFKNQTTFQPVQLEQMIDTIFADLEKHGYSIHQ